MKTKTQGEFKRLTDRHLIKAGEICLVDVYLGVGKSERKFKLIHKGDFVPLDFLQKYQEGELFIKSSRSYLALGNLSAVFVDLKQAFAEDKKLKIRDEFILQLQACAQTISILDLASFFFNEFNMLGEKDIEKYYERSSVLFKRSLAISTMTVLLAMLDDVVSLKALKDLYNVSFGLDMGLACDDDFCFFLMTAAELERKNEGSGLQYLRDNAPKEVLENFINHPNKSYDLLNQYAKLFSFPEWIELVRTHHENAESTGFPLGKKITNLTLFERYLYESDQVISYEQTEFYDGDLYQILSEHSKKDLNALNEKWLMLVAFDYDEEVAA